MKETAVVILNYNGEQYLRQFLPKVIEYSAGCEIVVADNCSTDDSVSYLRKNHPEITLLLLSCNAGYSAGYNEALSRIKARYYVLLNSDVEVTPNWTTPVIALFENDPSVAAAQPKILSYHKKNHFEYAGAGGGFIDSLGYPFCRGRLFLTLEEDKGQYDDEMQVFWATGACLFIKADIYHQFNGLDSDFFAHMEEIDLCWRLNNEGYKVMYSGKSTVFHVGGGTLPQTNPRKTYLNFRNGLALLYKNYSTLSLFTKFPVRIALDLIASLKFMLFDSFPDGVSILRAHFDFIREFRKNYAKRRRAAGKQKLHHLPTLFKGSIVFEYFIRGKRKFDELNF